MLETNYNVHLRVHPPQRPVTCTLRSVLEVDHGQAHPHQGKEEADGPKLSLNGAVGGCGEPQVRLFQGH